METSIKKRHKRKLQRDHVNVVIAGKSQRKNTRFSRIQLERKKREKRKRSKCSFEERITKMLPKRYQCVSKRSKTFTKTSLSKMAYIYTYTNKC